MILYLMDRTLHLWISGLITEMIHSGKQTWQWTINVEDVLPFEHGGYSIAMLGYQMVLYVPRSSTNLVKKNKTAYLFHPNFLTFQKDPNSHDWFWWQNPSSGVVLGQFQLERPRYIGRLFFCAAEVYSALRDVDDDVLMELRTRTRGCHIKVSPLGSLFFEIYTFSHIHGSEKWLHFFEVTTIGGIHFSLSWILEEGYHT